MADYDYPAVARPDDEEDQQKRLYNEMYPPVAPAGGDTSFTPRPTEGTLPFNPNALQSTIARPPTAGYPAPQPASAAPASQAAPQAAAAPANDTPAPAAPEARPDFSDLGPPVNAQPAAQPPNWKDFAPKERHGWGKVGSILATFQPNANEIVNNRPMRNAEQNYEAATSEFKEKEGQGKQQTAEDLEKAQAENQRAEANARTHPPADWKNVPGLVGPNNEPVEINEKTGEHRLGQIAGGVHPIKTPADTATQNKETFQHAIGVLRGEGLLGAGDVTDYKKIAGAVQNSKQLTPDEKNAAVGYLAANPTPGTNLQVHVAGQEEGDRLARNKIFEGSEVIAHMPDGRRLQMSYADAQAQGIAPERLVKLNAHEAQENRDKQASVQTSFQGLDRYRNNLKALAPKLSPGERDALRVLTSHTEKTAGALGGLIDDLPIAGPMTDYANRLMQGTITSDQYKQLKSPEAKKLVSDYFTSIIDNFASMKARLGSVGRNPAQLQAEINTIPLPYLDWESANGQFENKRTSLAGFAQSMPELYTPKK